MKLIFAGTPEFAAIALDALVVAGFDIALVVTQPDRPAGRGMQPRGSAVKRSAVARGLPLAQPASLKADAVQLHLRAARAEAMVVAAYALLLPPSVLVIPPRGCLNIHASLLPRWRGAAPIQRALLAGDSETGVTIMQMAAGLDTGPILLQETIAIEGNDTMQTLHDKLAVLGARLIVRALCEFPSPRAQDETKATYAAKISKTEAVIDWSRDAGQICRQVRAFDPTPGATTTLNGAAIKIWRAMPDALIAAAPGTIVRVDNNGIVVAAGEGAVRIGELQRAGGKRLAAAAFLSGTPLTPGARLGA